MVTKITGSSAKDTIVGTSGDDAIFSFEGHDKLYGGNGFDFLFGGLGGDLIRGGDGDDYLYGGDGTDNLIGDNGNDVLFAGANTSSGSDKMRGGNGDDTYVIGLESANIVIWGETANSGTNDIVVFDGQNFDDAYDVYFQTESNGSQTFNYRRIGLDGQLKYFKIKDYTQIETYSFNGVNYTAAQLAAKVNGVTDADARFFTLGSGSGLLKGTAQDDILQGGTGRDNLVGYEGDDVLISGGNNTTKFEALQGRDGNDTYIISKNAGYVMVRNETGGSSDRVIFEGLAFADADDIRLVTTNKGELEIQFHTENSLGESVQYRVRDYREIESFTFTDRTLTIDELDDALVGFADRALASDTIVNAGLQKYFNAPIDADDAASAAAQTTLIEYAAGPNAGSAFQFDTEFLAPQFAITKFDTPLGNLTGDKFTNGSDVFIGSDGDDNFKNLDSGDDVARGMGGNDTISGSNGYDVLFGDDGDDHLDGVNYGDLLFGGAGNDWIIGGAGQDVLIGGEGDDVMIASLAMEVVKGDAGNDIIVSRSDGAEPIVRLDGGVVELIVPDLVPFGSNNPDRRVPDSSGALVNDDLWGGEGNDTFVFEFTIGASNKLEHLFPDNANANANTVIDWTVIAGLNDFRHHHWMDGIGNDFIHDFEVGSDQIALIGHTVKVWDVIYDDFDGNGVLDSRIIAYSDHKDSQGTSLSHDGDLLGTITLVDAIITQEDLGVFDIPVHFGSGMTMPMTLQEQLTDPKWADLLSYVNREYIDEDGNALMGGALVEKFGSFESISKFQSYYSIDGASIKELQTNANGEQRAAFIGTSAADTLDIPELGQYVEAGAGDDIIRGWDWFTGNPDKNSTLLASDNVFGGAGNDNIYGGQLDDHLFGGTGNDTILGGGRHQEKNVGDGDILFGGQGDDTLDGGMDQDVLFGGDGNDRLISASDMQETGDDVYDRDVQDNFRFGGRFFDLEEEDPAYAFRSPRDPRTTNDLLFGGDGEDAFVFKILDAKVGTASNYDLIHVTTGVDVIADFDAGDDNILFDIRGDSSSVSLSYDEVMVDNTLATVISLTSSTTDDLSTHFYNVATGVDSIETDFTSAVSQVIVMGASAATVSNAVDLQFRTDTVFVSDHYSDYLL